MEIQKKTGQGKQEEGLLRLIRNLGCNRRSADARQALSFSSNLSCSCVCGGSKQLSESQPFLDRLLSLGLPSPPSLAVRAVPLAQLPCSPF